MTTRRQRPPAGPTGLVLSRPSTGGPLLVIRDGVVERDPYKAYIRGLSTDRSRASMIGALQRVTRKYFECEPEVFDWGSLDFQQMDALRTKLAEDFHVRTARHALSALRGVLRYAVRLKLLSREQYAEAIDLRPLKGFEEETGRALTTSEITRLRTHCGQIGGAHGAMLTGLLLGALLGAGLRAQEAVSLTVGAYRDGAIIVPGKGLKTRKVPLHTSAKDALDAWCTVRNTLGGGDALFLYVNEDGKTAPMSRWRVWKIVHDVSDDLGIEFSPHDFRRTFATELIRRSGDISAVQKLLGHAKPETTMRYDKRGDDALATFVEKHGG